MTEVMKPKMRLMPHAMDLPMPTERATSLDLVAAIHEPITIAPGRRALIPTGLMVALPPGLEGQIRPRDGLALRHGVTVLNGPVPAELTPGEIAVIVINLGADPFTVERGTPVARFVLAPVAAMDCDWPLPEWA